MRHRWLWLVGLATLLFVGCEKPGSKPTAAAPPAGPAPVATATTAPTATASTTPEAPEEAPVAAEVVAEEGPEPKAALHGVLINPAEGVQFLKPEGWTEIETPENGPIARLRRTKGIDGLQVTLTLTAEPRTDLGEEGAVEGLSDAYVASLGKQLEATGKVISQLITGQPTDVPLDELQFSRFQQK